MKSMIKIIKCIPLIFHKFKQDVIELKIKNDWRNKNSHNKTELVFPYVNYQCIHVGKDTYGPISAIIASPVSHLYIGNFCSIASEVSFVVAADHSTHNISTYPFRSLCLNKEQGEAVTKGDIIVDSVSAIKRFGVGTPYAIVGGVPAKIIGYRFEEEMRNELLKVDFSKLDGEMIKNNIDKLYTPLTSIEQLNWMPKL